MFYNNKSSRTASCFKCFEFMLTDIFINIKIAQNWARRGGLVALRDGRNIVFDHKGRGCDIFTGLNSVHIGSMVGCFEEVINVTFCIQKLWGISFSEERLVASQE